MKNTPTLADAVIRESLRPHGLIPKIFGDKVADARKFVLDVEASRFLSDLSHASYTGKPATLIKTVERVRVLARLPHSLTWIEYDPRAFRARTLEAYSDSVNHVVAESADGQVHAVTKVAPEHEIVKRIGWLMEVVDGTISAVWTFVGDDDALASALPFCFAWNSDEKPLPVGFVSALPPGSASDGFLATGINGYDSAHVRIGIRRGAEGISARIASHLVAEFTGELRFIWALLAAINDIPIGMKHIRPTKGFVARGRYRRFFEHSVISLILPKGRDPRVVACQAVEMSRRRAHMVRGHWRVDWRRPLHPLCPHEFAQADNTLHCKLCFGQKMFVHEHIRGDEKLGFVVHDYAIKHEEAK